jgi:hypothetical protein
MFSCNHGSSFFFSFFFPSYLAVLKDFAANETIQWSFMNERFLNHSLLKRDNLRATTFPRGQGQVHSQKTFVNGNKLTAKMKRRHRTRRDKSQGSRPGIVKKKKASTEA